MKCPFFHSPSNPRPGAPVRPWHPAFLRALRFEQLEDRRLLSATHVASTIDAGTSIQAVLPDLLGVNLAYYDDQQGTAETQQLTEAAGLQLFRFPGGEAADVQHFNVAGGITIPQFAQFISSVGGTGIVTVDYGSGSPQEAAAELAYLEGSPSDTTVIGSGLEWNDTTSQWQSVDWGTVGYWASLRAASPLAVDDGLNFLRIDHSAPFANITDWEIGNEQYYSSEPDFHGTPGPGGVSTGAAHDPATYAAFSAQFSTLAAEITQTAGLPSISIGVDSGDPIGQSDGDWTKDVLTDELADGLVPGFISDHSYAQVPGTESDSTLLNGTVTDPSSILDWSTRYAAYESLIQQVEGSQASQVEVIATEYNSVGGSPGKQSTSLVNGLYVAESLGELMDSGYSAAAIWDWNNNEEPGNNNSSSLYGWREFGDYGLVGNDFETDLPAAGLYVPFPSYFGIQLASKIDLAGGVVVPATSTDSDLNVYAVKEANGHLELLVVNTSPTTSAIDQFNTTGFQPTTAAEVWQYGETQDTAQENSATGDSALAYSTVKLTTSGNTFSYTFPAYSMTVLDVAPIAVTPSGAHASYTAGMSPVAIDAGLTVTSGETDLTGATVTISAGTLLSGDTLSFISPTGSGIHGVYSGGVLTLSGTATVAQYQAALRSVTFANTTNPNITTRDLSIVAVDNSLVSNTAAEQVTLNPGTPKVVAVDTGGTYNGSRFPATATATGLGGASVSGSFALTYYVGNSASGTGSSTAPTGAGTYTVVATFTSTDPDYASASSKPVTFTIGAIVPINLAPYFTRVGITANGQPFTGGLDGGGNALSEQLLGSSLTAGGVKFNIGPAGAADVVPALGQTIVLPAAPFATLQLLATAVNGNQPNQTFVVHYTDGTSTTITQSLSDWYTPQCYAGESVALTMPYRNQSNGREGCGRFDLYQYTLTLNASKTVASITLPNNKNVEVLAISLVAPVPVATNLTASAAGCAVNLSWVAAGGTVTGYNVYRGTASGGESTTPLNATPLAPGATSFHDTSVVAGNAYYYVVRAVDGPALGGASNQASALVPATGSTTAVDLRGAFNLVGITAGGQTFHGGLDGSGDALSANLLGSTLTASGVKFNIGATSGPNVVQSIGQTISLPPGSFSQLDLLATAVNGNQKNQTFVVHYTDGTSQTFTQSLSDWLTPQHYGGESVALQMNYRNQSNGRENCCKFDVYSYTLTLNPTKTVASITLPDNKNVDVLAITAVH
jgi:hypothetical protein